MSLLYGLGQPSQPRHKVFISYHHANDQSYRNRFENLFANIHDVIVSKSVQIGDINPFIDTDTLRQKIRDEYLSDSTVTVVLVGKDTWQRKHVDWEISASIRQTKNSPRSGLLGILLPTYPRPSPTEYYIYTIPPRLYDNFTCSFAKLYGWSEDPRLIQTWIHEAFEKRNRINPDNSFASFKNNRSGNEWQK